MPRQANLKKIPIVALVLENDQGEILIAKRHKNKHQGGLWEFPGGKVEEGETHLQALKREIKEEIDYEIKHATTLKHITHSYEDITIKLDVWYSKVKNPKVKANEKQTIKWVRKSQLPQLKMPAANRPVIQKLLGNPIMPSD